MQKEAEGCMRCGAIFDPETAEGWFEESNGATPFPKLVHTCPRCCGDRANYFASKRGKVEQTETPPPAPPVEVVEIDPDPEVLS